MHGSLLTFSVDNSIEVASTRAHRHADTHTYTYTNNSKAIFNQLLRSYEDVNAETLFIQSYTITYLHMHTQKKNASTSMSIMNDSYFVLAEKKQKRNSRCYCPFCPLREYICRFFAKELAFRFATVVKMIDRFRENDSVSRQAA